MRKALITGLACAAALAAVLALSSCGSDSDSTTDTLSKAAFLKQGNAICKQGNEKIEKSAEEQFPRSGPKPSKGDLREFVTKTVLPSVQSQVDGIEALGAPAGDEAEVEAILDEAQASLDKAKKDPTLLTGNGPDPFAKTNELAKAYGLTACAEEG